MDAPNEGAEVGQAPAPIGPVRRYGRYTLVKKLATGGMAEIWLARQRGLAGFNRFVVIKKILTHLSEQETFVKMFLDEARTSAQLNHPNIVQIYDLGKEAESYYIAMEFIAGENLAAIAWRGMKRGRPLHPLFAARIIADACKALHYAHHLKGSDGRALEIVHRDISPQNILVTYEGEVKVVDFGIAKAATKSEHTRTGMLKGKFSYMSPEQCLGTSVDMRSDVFALGILLYELCTGKRLFKHESELMILDMITKRDVVPPSQVAREISPRLERIIMKALSKPVENRYQTAQEMQVALEDYLRDEDRSATNTELAVYMRSLFEDKIEEKRLLREAASRDDFESTFSEDEPTEQDQRRRPVQGLSPSQIRAMGGTPAGNGYFAQTSMPGSAAGVPYPYGTQPGAFPGSGASYPGGYPASVAVEPTSWFARVVIVIAFVIILVASYVLYQQLSPATATEAPLTVKTVAPTKTGRILLESKPAGAAIYLDDKPMLLDTGEPAKTPSDLTSLQYGNRYRIRLVKEGYETFEQEVLMDENAEREPIRPVLRARPGRLVAEVAGARGSEVRVFLGDEEIGVGPRVTKDGLKAHETVLVSAKLEGHTCVATPQRVMVRPDATETTTIRCEPARRAPDKDERSAREAGPKTRRDPEPKTAATPPPAPEPKGGCRPTPGLPPGYATINSTPWAEIYIGERKIGDTPLPRYKLPAGCVEVRAVSQDGRERRVELKIEPNVVSIFKIDIK